MSIPNNSINILWITYIGNVSLPNSLILCNLKLLFIMRKIYIEIIIPNNDSKQLLLIPNIRWIIAPDTSNIHDLKLLILILLRDIIKDE